MSWRGSVEVTGEGRDIRLGMTVIPERATFKATGEKGAPDVVARFEVRDGRPEMVEVLVKTKADGRGIRSSDMEVFNENLIRNVYALIGRQFHSDPGGLDGWRSGHLRMTTCGPSKARLKGRGQCRCGTVNIEELKKVKETYEAHMGNAPTKAVEEILDYTPRTAARRVQQAREAGLLLSLNKGEKK